MMMKPVSSALVVGALSVTVAAFTFSPAAAQSPRRAAVAAAPAFCPEGRLASGACINPGLAAVARKRAIVITQQKFSYSTRLVLPGQERAYPVPFDYREYQRGTFSTAPFPLSCHPNC